MTTQRVEAIWQSHWTDKKRNDMNCDCTITSGNIPRIVRGNDFTLVVSVKRAVLQDSETVLEDFDLSTATDIAVNRVSRLGKKVAMTYTVEGSKVLIDFDETVPSGMYGIEVTGKTDGKDWRFYAQPGEAIEIVEPTSEANIPSEDTTEGYYNLTAQAGVVTLPDELLTEAVEKANTATANANKATEDANTAEAKRVEAENARVLAENTRQNNESQRQANNTYWNNQESTRNQQEAARVQAEAARVNAESGRQSQETARQSAESARQNAESARAAAEEQRATDFAQIQTDAASATSAANTAAEKANSAATDANTAAKAANDAVASMAATYTTASAVSDTTEYSDISSILS